MKKHLLFVVLMGCYLYTLAIDSLTVCSPSGRICIKIWMDTSLKYRIYENGKSILEPSEIGMILKNVNPFSTNNKMVSHSEKSITNQIISPVPEKRKIITDNYHSLFIAFTQPFKIEFRAYDDGVAYRWMTTYNDSITILNEVAEFHFPDIPAVYFPAVHRREDADIFHTSFEELYEGREILKIGKEEIAYSPVVVSTATGGKMGITESDLEDYPGMFLSGTGWLMPSL